MTTAADLGLSEHQYRNLLGCVAAVQARPAMHGRIRGAYLIAAACLAESGMQMYANINVPESFSGRYEYVKISWATATDGLGEDHASIGMLQQQVGPSFTRPIDGQAFHRSTVSDDTWGNVAQLMDPTYSANKFLERLERLNWESDPFPWASIQSVQGSAYDGNPRRANNFNDEYGGNYHATWSEARRLVDAVWGQAPAVAMSRQLGGFLMALTDEQQQFIYDELQWWHTRRAKFDLVAWSILGDDKGQPGVRSLLQGVRQSMSALVKKK
jgi:hypothetical protein